MQFLPLIEALPVRSCVVDGEAIVCGDNGLAVFDLIRGHGTNARAILCAFDLLEVNGEDQARADRESQAQAGRGCCGCRTTASPSMRPSAARARSSTSTHARLAARTSCPNASVRSTVPAASVVHAEPGVDLGWLRDVLRAVKAAT